MGRTWGTLLAVVLVTTCATPATSQQNPAIEEGYVRPKIAPLEMPSVRGERYQNTVPDTENIQPDFPNSEGCCVADMVAFSLKLSVSGVGDY